MGLSVFASSERLALDERPVIEVVGLERLDGGWRILGTAVAPEGELLVRYSDRRGREVVRSCRTSVGAPFRGDWSLIVDNAIAETEVTLDPGDMEETPRDVRVAETVRFVLPRQP